MDGQDGRNDVAVIDVGSNSVRLVMYRLEGRAIWTVYNEKVLAGLGRDIAATGRLSPEGVKMALPALRRFAAIVEGVRPAAVLTAATAAVRDAEDGEEFRQRVAAETSLQVRVLTGEEEARYAALGVLAGAPDSKGIAADLGGASLELCRVGDGKVEGGVTLPLGPFSLATPEGFDPDHARALIAERLKPMAKDYSGAVLHAVGGGWRSLAQIHMAMVDHPLRIVHQYAMTAQQARDTAHLVAHQSPASLARTPGVSKRRVETLPYAALVLEGLLEHCGFERVEFSAWGLREGLLFESLAPSLVSADPLLASCEAIGLRQGVSPGLPGALEGWLTGVMAALPAAFGEERDGVITAAACRLADVGARLHPDHRVELAFDQVLRAPAPGQTHAERAFLACAINARYGGSEETPAPRVMDRLLNDEQRLRARALGLAMRLGSDMSVRSPQILASTVVSLKGGVLRLKATADHADALLGEQTRRRAKALAELLNATLEIG